MGTPSASNSSIVSATPSAASAEWRNRPAGPKAATMPRLSVACVMLQRVPPDMRILTPGLAVLFEQQRACPALRRLGGRHQAGRPRANDDRVPIFLIRC